MLSEQQLANRSKGLGGSDIAPILGKSPYRTALDIFAEKTGKVAREDLSHNENVAAGNYMESGIAQLYAWKNGIEIYPFTDTIFHPDYPFLLANPDYYDNEGGVIEIKNMDVDVARSYGWPNNFQAPTHYMIQLIYYCWMVGATYGKLVCFITGSRYEVTHYERDESIEQWMSTNAIHFWQEHVLKEVPPSPSTLKDVQFLFPVSESKQLIADSAIEKLVNEYGEINTQVSSLAKRKEEIHFLLASYMGEHDTLLSMDDQVIATYKSHERTSFDTTRFKEDHPALYSTYLKKGSARPFVVKKASAI